jgi:WD40 repeat protein
MSSRDGARLATGSEPGWVRLRDARTGKLQCTLGSLVSEASSVAFSPDAQSVAAAGGDPLEDEVAELKLWDARTGRLLRSRRRGGDFLNLVAFLPPGGPLPPRSDEVGTLQLWDTRPGGRQWLVVAYDPTPSHLSPDGKTLADAGGGEAVTLRDARTLRLQRTLQPRGHQVEAVAFSSDSKTLAVATAPSTGNDLELWDVRTGRLKRSIPALGTKVNSLAYGQDCRTLVTGDERGALELWDTNSRRWLATFLALAWEGERASQWIAYSPGGYYEGSPGVERFIRWRVGGQLFPGERYERTFHRPDLVHRALQGRASPTPIPASGPGE